MRPLLLVALLACGGSDSEAPRADATQGDEAAAQTPESAPRDEPAVYADAPEAVAATEALLSFVAGTGEPSALPAHLETLADAVAREGSQITARLRAGADELRQREMSERDRRETIEIALSLLWPLIEEREPPDPSLCAIGRVLALHGVAAWRRALTERIEGEGGSLEEASVAPDCSGLDEVGSEAEECAYAAALAEAHRVAFALDGPLARIEAGLRTGPAASAAAIAAHVDDLHPLRGLISVRPRTRDLEDLGAMCRPGA